MIEVIGIKNANKLVPIEDDEKPIDPVTENQNMLTLKKPVKAFMEQNHQAHIAAHTSMLQNPQIMNLLQQNPMMQQIVSGVQAHIAEHMGMEYRKQIEMTIGGVLPSVDEKTGEEPKISPEMADQIAIAVAQASGQMAQMAQAQAQQQQAQQKMQDPIVQMQMQELQLKQGELQLKQQKQQIEAASKADQLRIEESRIAMQKEIAAMQVGATAAAARDKLQKQQELEGTKLGIDIAKHKSEMAHNRTSTILQNIQKNKQPKKGA
jgi:hypothetical protein